MKKILWLIILLALLGILAYASPQVRGILMGLAPIATPAPELPEGEPLPFTLPPNFTAHLFSNETPGARVLALGPKATLVVSLTGEGKVVALPDANADGVADETITILDGLDKPHGILFACDYGTGIPEACEMFVAETDMIRVYAYDPDTYTATFKADLLALPSGGNHFTRTLFPHPDGEHVLVSIGSSCNVCNEDDPLRATILSVDLRSGASATYAHGLRNTVFMALHPVTGDLWGTDMGRDLLGDTLPPDEINILREGEDYGWPTCFGDNNHDTDFDKNTYIRNPCMEPFETPSHIDLPAHVAPLGLAFVPEEGWPEEYWHDLFVAEHGSWNSSTPVGYKIVRIPLTPNGNPDGAPVDFMTGFLPEGGEAIGRPVSLLIFPGGTMYVSDDRAGAIYTVLYRPQE